MWKDFLYYTKGERRGIIILMIVIVVGLCLIVFFPFSHEVRLKEDSSFMKEYDAFIRSIEITNRKEYNKYYHQFQHREVILAPFDPNTADSLTFLRLGLPPWMAHNIIKYRKKGGKFRKPDDFRKIYGLSNEQFMMLCPYITIQEIKRDTVRLLAVRDTTHRYPIKYKTIVKMELNSVDTTELRKIPGVGSGIAKMIVNYRQQLGGFYSVRQLDEIHLISANLSKWFTLNTALIKKIRINQVSLNRLNAHPYINFYQAKAIMEFRRKHGALRTLKQLSLYEEFSESDFERLSFYITFD
jgi:DNA uptake protein ComE-like DNA-binding protein